MSSAIDGRSCEVIANTASAAASIDRKTATIVDAGGGAGINRRISSVMIPSSPSEPTKAS